MDVPATLRVQVSTLYVQLQTSLQLTLLPVGVVLRNRIVSFPEVNGSTTYSRAIPWWQCRCKSPPPQDRTVSYPHWSPEQQKLHIQDNNVSSVKYIAARWENLPPPINCDVMQLDCLVVRLNDWFSGYAAVTVSSALRGSTIHAMNICSTVCFMKISEQLQWNYSSVVDLLTPHKRIQFLANGVQRRTCTQISAMAVTLCTMTDYHLPVA